MVLVRIIARNFVAGAVITDSDRVLYSAPILRKYKTMRALTQAALANRWQIQRVELTDG